VRRGRGLAAVLLAAVAVSGCSDDDSSSEESRKQTTPMKVDVRIVNSRYTPAKVKVLAGGTVTFMNLDKRKPHTAETKDLMFLRPDEPFDPEGDFDTHTLSWGEPYTVTFHKPGLYKFHCSYEDMYGAVEVQTADPTKEVPGS
jgi:plastocyanin